MTNVLAVGGSIPIQLDRNLFYSDEFSSITVKKAVAEQDMATIERHLIFAATLVNQGSENAEDYLCAVAREKRKMSEKALLMIAALPQAYCHKLILARKDCTVPVVTRVAMSTLEVSARENKMGNFEGFEHPDLPLWLLKLAVDIQLGLARRGLEPWLALAVRPRPELPLEALAALPEVKDLSSPYAWDMRTEHWTEEKLNQLRDMYPELDGLPVPMMLDVVSRLVPASREWREATVPAHLESWADQMVRLARGERL